MSEAPAEYGTSERRHGSTVAVRCGVPRCGWRQRDAAGRRLRGRPDGSGMPDAWSPELSSRLASQWTVRERGNGRLAGIPETILHAAWRKAGKSGSAVTGRDGHQYRIIYSGRPADGAGPDFRDAVLLRDDGVQLHGDVEVHVRSGDWHGHGHGLDRAYNGVVLHVALEETGAPAQTDSGIRIPLLLLRRSLVETAGPERPGRGSEDLPGAEDPADPPAAAPLPFLDMSAAGDEWFRNRSHGSLLQIAASGSDQALWEGALECLGYPANKRGFRQVAARLDWEAVARAVSGMPLESLAELFAWAGGFGPKPEGAPQLRGPAPSWSPRHGRPANHPRTRLIAAAAWAARWSQAGGPARAFTDAVRRANRPDELLSVFAVSTANSPAGPGLSLPRVSPPRVSPLGKARAADAVVNQLLPAVHALAIGSRDGRLAAHAKRLFATHPLLQPNSVTREASRLLRMRCQSGESATPQTARDQQGLIHIYRMATSAQHPDRQLPLL